MSGGHRVSYQDARSTEVKGADIREKRLGRSVKVPVSERLSRVNRPVKAKGHDEDSETEMAKKTTDRTKGWLVRGRANPSGERSTTRSCSLAHYQN